LIGPPGVGKGTQAVLLAQKLNVATLSSGLILRQHVEAGSELGRQVAPILDAGGLVPDEMMSRVVESQMADTDSGFILDGYPRTVRQAVLLDDFLARRGVQVDLAVELQAPVAVIVDRLLDRGQTSGRTDDTREVIERRLEVFRRETAPVTEHYARLGILAVIDGAAHTTRVTRDIMAELR
jgi:adenylate kinase